MSGTLFSALAIQTGITQDHHGAISYMDLHLAAFRCSRDSRQDLEASQRGEAAAVGEFRASFELALTLRSMRFLCEGRAF